MTEEERRAAEIQKAMAARSRADADEDNANGQKLNRLLSFLEDMKTTFGARLDSLEARHRDDADKDKDERSSDGTKPGEAEMTAADSADALAEVQSKYDDLALQFGKKIPSPLIGDSTRSYRLRCLRQFQKFADSKEFREADLSTISDEKVISGIERAVFLDAATAAAQPDVPNGQLLEVCRPDKSGRMISTFYGPQTFVKLMSRPARYIQSVRRDWK